MLLTTSFSHINLLAVLVAGIAHMLTGLIWYRPKFFGNTWANLTGAELKPAPKWLAAGIIGHQVIALVLAIIVNLANATTMLGGIAMGGLVWIWRLPAKDEETRSVRVLIRAVNRHLWRTSS